MKRFIGVDVSKNDYPCTIQGYKNKTGFRITKRHFCDVSLLLVFKIKKLTIALYDRWLGFDYQNFGSKGKRKDFGFFKFWIDK
jgi:hypothetical protein